MTMVGDLEDESSKLEGVACVVSALPYAAFVLDLKGEIMCANSFAHRVFDTEFSNCSRKAALNCDTQLVQKLKRLTEQDQPTVLKLRNLKAETHHFHGVRLVDPRSRDLNLFLLVADNTDIFLRKILNRSPGFQEASRRFDMTRQRHIELRREAAELRRLSETDPLTGLLNIRAFEAKVKDALLDGTTRSGTMVFIDLNEFKSVNDQFGHEIGDKLLQQVAEALRYPKATGISSARIGGDEFALWIPSAEEETLEETVAAIRQRIAKPLGAFGVQIVKDRAPEGIEICVTAALGVAHAPTEANTFAALRRLADTRMYSDKARQKHPIAS